MSDSKHRITVRLEPGLLERVRLVAAREGVSVSALLARYVKAHLNEAESYEAARQGALDTMERGFHLGGVHPAGRESLHER